MLQKHGFHPNTDIMDHNQVCFIPHCDYPSCDLGSVQYNCAACQKHTINYDLYFDIALIYNAEPVVYKCAFCNEDNEFFYYDGSVFARKRY